MSAVEAVAWPVELPQHLSASQLAKFARCPEQYRQRYLLYRKERAGAALLLGNADHAAHEHNFRQKITTRVDLPLDEVQDAYVDALAKAVDENGGESEIAWGDDNLTRIKDDGAKLVAAYHERVSPLIQPVVLEERFEYALPSLGVPLVGYVDLHDERRGIVERKTTTKAETKPKGQWVIQGLLYRMAKRLPTEWHLSVRTATPQIVLPESPPPPKAKANHPGYGALRMEFTPGCDTLAERYLGRLVRNLHAAYLMYGPDEPWQGARDDGWACAYCSYRKNHCPWWQS